MADEWALQSGFDGDELLARPSIELVTVDSVIAKQAEQQIESCEHCHPADAEIPLDWLLAEVTVKRGPYEFVDGCWSGDARGMMFALKYAF